jgi:hypothetical protein
VQPPIGADDEPAVLHADVTADTPQRAQATIKTFAQSVIEYGALVSLISSGERLLFNIRSSIPDLPLAVWVGLAAVVLMVRWFWRRA